MAPGARSPTIPGMPTLRFIRWTWLALCVLLAAGFFAFRAAGATPLRTILVVPVGQKAPSVPMVQARDCVHAPRTCVNGIGTFELAYATRGAPPARTTAGVVLTDTDCAADANGISHCRNVVRLAGGKRLVLRHDHRMSNDPCLSPGEHVRVIALAAFLRG